MNFKKSEEENKFKITIGKEKKAYLSASVDFPWSEFCLVEQKKVIGKWHMYQCVQ